MPGHNKKVYQAQIQKFIQRCRMLEGFQEHLEMSNPGWLRGFPILFCFFDMFDLVFFIDFSVPQNGTSKMALVVPQKATAIKHLVSPSAPRCSCIDFINHDLVVHGFLQIHPAESGLRTLVLMTLIWMEMATSPERSLIRPRN